MQDKARSHKPPSSKSFNPLKIKVQMAVTVQKQKDMITQKRPIMYIRFGQFTQPTDLYP